MFCLLLKLIIMNKVIISILVLLLCQIVHGVRDFLLVGLCHSGYGKCSQSQFDCRCEDARAASPAECIPRSWWCDGIRDCIDGSDELDCICDSGLHQCGCDYGGGCSDVNDIYYCVRDPRDCPMSKIKKSFNVCGWPGFIADGCNEVQPCLQGYHPCECSLGSNYTCKGFYYCFGDGSKCDGRPTCSDYSDEMNCTCPDDMFTCDCYKTNPMSCTNLPGCVPMSRVNNGRADCSDGSDEIYTIDLITSPGDACSLTYLKVANETMCNRIGFPACDNSTCVRFPTFTDSESTLENNLMCTSYCPDYVNISNYFQCSDKHLALSDQFCDGKIDCKDGSDENHNTRGFKCVDGIMDCVLPQYNLYDNIAHCPDKSDLCFTDNGLSKKCFKCFDGRLIIPSKQVCDGVIDCYDLSDECLCQINFNAKICRSLFSSTDVDAMKCDAINPACSVMAGSRIIDAVCQGTDRNSAKAGNSSTNCKTKWSEITPKFCDGRPECKDFKDECSCDNPPSFCNDKCHSFYSMGDRYCDGHEDGAWKYLNNSDCPRGFDERKCPQRYSCKAGHLVSIDKSKVRDGIIDCDDGSDEEGKVFSSKKEMIRNVGLRILFWVMALITICGNVYVILFTIYKLSQKNMTGISQCNHFLILNLSFADLLMGVYLLIIAIKSTQYSGLYGQVDSEWRSSTLCNVAGSIAIISSETSCFLMTIISTFRLYNVFKPFTARFAPILRWKLLTVSAWLVAVLLAVIPVINLTSDYFVHHIWFSNRFTRSEQWRKSDITDFACRLATLTNTSIIMQGNTWESTNLFFDDHFPMYSPKGEFGYYSETSVCLPRFFVAFGDNAWEYSIAIISINFILFLYVVGSYIVIYKITSARPLQGQQANEQSKTMQKRIARLLVTDFACWIPICIMAYLKLAGVYLSPDVYAISAALLLPINSAMNPLLYSPIADTVLKKIQCKKRDAKTPQPTERVTCNTHNTSQSSHT